METRGFLCLFLLAAPLAVRAVQDDCNYEYWYVNTGNTLSGGDDEVVIGCLEPGGCGSIIYAPASCTGCLEPGCPIVEIEGLEQGNITTVLEASVTGGINNGDTICSTGQVSAVGKRSGTLSNAHEFASGSNRGTKFGFITTRANVAKCYIYSFQGGVVNLQPESTAEINYTLTPFSGVETSTINADDKVLRIVSDYPVVISCWEGSNDFINVYPLTTEKIYGYNSKSTAGAQLECDTMATSLSVLPNCTRTDGTTTGVTSQTTHFRIGTSTNTYGGPAIACSPAEGSCFAAVTVGDSAGGEATSYMRESQRSTYFVVTATSTLFAINSGAAGSSCVFRDSDGVELATLVVPVSGEIVTRLAPTSTSYDAGTTIACTNPVMIVPQFNAEEYNLQGLEDESLWSGFSSSFLTCSPTTSPTDAPSFQPTQTPTATPTFSPSASPSVTPSKSPSQSPSASPSISPTSEPTSTPTNSPSKSPSQAPSQSPTAAPSSEPTSQPTGRPSDTPTATPSQSPSSSPTSAPSNSPTRTPSESPSVSPTTVPTTTPSSSPSPFPSSSPTSAPTTNPSASPSRAPSASPTTMPTNDPTESPSQQPSEIPTGSPTQEPTALVTSSPTTNGATGSPTASPTSAPSQTPTSSPTSAPSLPTSRPSQSPTELSQSPTTVDEAPPGNATVEGAQAPDLTLPIASGTMIGLLAVAGAAVAVFYFRKKKKEKDTDTLHVAAKTVHGVEGSIGGGTSEAATIPKSTQGPRQTALSKAKAMYSSSRAALTNRFSKKDPSKMTEAELHESINAAALAPQPRNRRRSVQALLNLGGGNRSPGIPEVLDHEGGESMTSAPIRTSVPKIDNTKVEDML